MIDSIQKLDKEMQKIFKVPASYIIFAAAVIKYLYSSELNKATLSLFVSKNLQESVLQVFNFVYSFDILRGLSIVLFGASMVFFFVREFLLQFNILPQEENMVDGTTVFWNGTSAIKKPLRFLKKYFTTYWTWYFSVHVFLGTKVFESTNIRHSDFWLNHVFVHGVNTNQLNPSSVLLILNIGMLIYYCGIALFKNRIETQYWSIDQANRNSFECLDSFQVEDTTVFLFKPKYLTRAKKDTYLIAQGEKTFFESDKIHLKITDTSHNFAEIRFHFKNIENGRVPLDKG